MSSVEVLILVFSGIALIGITVGAGSAIRVLRAASKGSAASSMSLILAILGFCAALVSTVMVLIIATGHLTDTITTQLQG